MVHQGNRALVPTASGEKKEYMPSAQLAKRLPSAWPRPAWHAPWRMYRVVVRPPGVRALPPLTLSRMPEGQAVRPCRKISATDSANA